MIVISGNTLSFYTPNVYSYTQAMIVPARNYVTFKVKGTVCCAQWMKFYRNDIVHVHANWDILLP